MLFVSDAIGVLCFSFFFFKQKTAYEMRISDWSSDVCSSDLIREDDPRCGVQRGEGRADHGRAGGDSQRVEGVRVVPFFSPPACGRGRGRACLLPFALDMPSPNPYRKREGHTI